MNNSSYLKRLEDPRWQRLRLKVFERDGFTCRYCGDTEERLAVHHLYYVSGREPWEYPLGAFKTACSTCHRQIKDEAAERVEDWEYLCALENENESHSSYVLADTLIHTASEIGVPIQDLYFFLVEMIALGLIDRKLFETWRECIRGVHVGNVVNAVEGM